MMKILEEYNTVRPKSSWLGGERGAGGGQTEVRSGTFFKGYHCTHRKVFSCSDEPWEDFSFHWRVGACVEMTSLSL